MRARLPLTFVALSVVIAVQGCGGGGVRYAPVSGKVTMDGKPLVGVNVMFIPLPKPGSEIAGSTAGGMTDENGQYTLKTSTPDGGLKDGAQVGKHKVSISLQKSWGEGDRSITRETIPKKYNEATTLSADVGDGKPIDFALTSR